MATKNDRSDRFTWKEGDLKFSPGFKTKAERIKDGTYKPAEKPHSTAKKSSK